MKAPVGLLSDRTVLRQQDGGASPRQVILQGLGGVATKYTIRFLLQQVC